MASSERGWAPEIRQLALQLGSSSDYERKKAEQYIYSLGTNAIGVLKHLMDYELYEQRRRREQRVHENLARGIVGGIGLVLAFLSRSGAGVSGIIGVALALMAVSVVSAVAAQLQPLCTPSYGVRLLARYEDIRIVGPLLAVLGSLDRESGAVVEKALVHLLPRLRAADASLLDETHRDCLYRALNGTNADLILAILRRWSRWGIARRFPTCRIWRMARGLPRQTGAFAPRLKNACPSCASASNRRKSPPRSCAPRMPL